MDFLRYLLRGAKDMPVVVPVWKGPVITVASMCQHLDGSVGVHRFVVFDLGRLVLELGAGMPVGEAVPLGGVRMGQIGIVLEGFAATDIWAVLRNVVWEDVHCAACCGALLRFSDGLGPYVLTRCGPTIGSSIGAAEARSVIDEYWTD